MEDVHAHYGIDPAKELSVLVFGTKGDQAKRDQFADISSLLINKACFAPFLGKHTTSYVSLLTYEQLATGAVPGRDMGLIVVRACETTQNAARGAAVPVLVLDEISQLEGAGSTADGNAIWRAATPSTTQFREDRMIILSSSPAEKTGPQYARYQESLAIDPDTGTAANPHIFMLQAPSWEPYEGWEQAHELPAWPGAENFAERRRAMIEPDDDEVLQMLQTDPDDHAVEYLGQFRSARSAYLPLGLVLDAFGLFNDAYLQMQDAGPFTVDHFIHVDTSLVGKNTAATVGHVENVDGAEHLVIDLIRVWKPSDFADGRISYSTIEDEVFDLIRVWKPSDFADGRISYSTIEDEVFDLIVSFNAVQVTFDQYNSAQLIQRLNQRIADAKLPRACVVFERTATGPVNFQMAEVFKAAAGERRIHIPDHALARLELEYIQIDGKKVHAPTTGPVRTDDVAVALFNLCYVALEASAPTLFARLAGLQIRASQPTGMGALVEVDPSVADQFSAAGRWRPRESSHDPARGINPHRRPHPRNGL